MADTEELKVTDIWAVDWAAYCPHCGECNEGLDDPDGVYLGEQEVVCCKCRQTFIAKEF